MLKKLSWINEAGEEESYYAKTAVEYDAKYNELAALGVISVEVETLEN